MERLTLEHLAPYLPYGIELVFVVRDKIRYVGKITSLVDIQEYDDIKIRVGYNDAEHIWMFKPILRPLSDMTKEIEHNGERFVPSKVLSAWDLQGICVGSVIHAPYNLFEIFIKWHFDVFGLIAAGLAVDINTLEGAS